MCKSAILIKARLFFPLKPPNIDEEGFWVNFGTTFFFFVPKAKRISSSTRPVYSVLIFCLFLWYTARVIFGCRFFFKKALLSFLFLIYVLWFSFLVRCAWLGFLFCFDSWLRCIFFNASYSSSIFSLLLVIFSLSLLSMCVVYSSCPSW